MDERSRGTFAARKRKIAIYLGRRDVF